jgi:UDP-2-acetamido-2-deoxy-ribo-hexuluronate aminotransferase
MDAIQMVDLKKQYRKIKPEIDAAIAQVIDNAAFIGGQAVKDFGDNLAKYLGVKHVIPCANGTDALQIAMMALNLQPGDEVITPSFTYIATTEVMALLKLKPVFVEVDPKTFNITPLAIEAAITPKTKAIVPVHLYGQACNMEAIMDIANKYNIPVIEDNAQAIGSTYNFSNGSSQKLGTIGTIGCTSFFPSKNLGCYGDGGAIFTNDDELAVQLRMIANHGQSKQYYHDVVGCNSRLDGIQAAVLNVKLPLLDDYIAARVAVADKYDAAFANNPKLSTPYRSSFANHVFHQYTLQLQNVDNVAEYRNKMKEWLATKNVPSMIYYPVAAHDQKMFESFGSSATELPVTDWLTERVISLPIHTEMDSEQQQYIIEQVLEYINN